MKKTVLAAISATALLTLAACAEDEADTTIVETGAEEPAPIDMPDATSTTMVEGETDGDSVSISEDGMQADINDGDTSVSADIDEDPSLTVED